MKILVVSNTPWNKANSFGATFTSLFKSLSKDGKVEIANIYCNRGLPDGSVDGQFLQITENQIIKSIFKKNTPKALRVTAGGKTSCGNAGDKGIYSFFRKTRLQVFYWARDLIWLLAGKNITEIDDFVKDFQPDVIFSPLYSLYHTNRIVRKVKALTGKPLVMYVYDDVYSLKQKSFSPLFWIDRFMKRRAIRKTVSMCEMLYTICEAQKNEYAKELFVPCKELHKPADNIAEDTKIKLPCVGENASFLYAGNIGNGRWKTLCAIGKALPQKISFSVYTGTPLSGPMKRAFKKSRVNVFPAVSPEELALIEEKATALVYAEPFGGKGACLSRLSLSTKLPGYLSSGKPVLAVGKGSLASIEYLLYNDAAVVATSREQTFHTVRSFVSALFSEGPENHRLKKIIENARQCAKRDFSETQITTSLYDDLKKRAEGLTKPRYLHVNAVCGKNTGSTGALTAGLCDMLSEVADNYVISAETRFFFRAEQKLHALLSRITGYQARFSFFETRKIIDKIKKIQPERIYLGNLHSNFVNVKKMLEFTGKQGIEVNVILHDCWFLNGKCNYNQVHNCDGALCREANSCHKCPGLKKDIPSWFFDRSKKQFAEKKRLLGAQRKVTFIGVSHAVLKEAEKTYGDLANAKFATIYNWYNEREFFGETFLGERELIRNKIGAALGFDVNKGKIISCAASTWTEAKGLLNIAELGKKLGNDYCIILAGKSSCGRLSDDKNYGDNIFFAGALSQKELRDLFLASDAVVSVSKAETFGLTMAEAMACGTPVVAFDGFGAEEIAGLLYKEFYGKEMPVVNGNIDAMTSLIKEYCSIPRAEIDKTCEKVTKTYFSKDVAAKNYLHK